MSRDFNSARPSHGAQIVCLFCNEQFLALEELREHFVLCGNKTDQCPVCRQFIRRAIFAYHYENKCANLDDPASPKTAKPHSFEANRPKTSNAIPCEYCKKDIHVSDYPEHEKSCSNQRTMANQALSQNTAYSNQNQSFGNQRQNINDIPCEFCHVLMDQSRLMDHQRDCTMQPRVPQNPNWFANQNSSRQLQCNICHKTNKSEQSNIDHQRDCARNHGYNSYARVVGGVYYPSSHT